MTGHVCERVPITDFLTKRTTGGTLSPQKKEASEERRPNTRVCECGRKSKPRAISPNSFRKMPRAPAVYTAQPPGSIPRRTPRATRITADAQKKARAYIAAINTPQMLSTQRPYVVTDATRIGSDVFNAANHPRITPLTEFVLGNTAMASYMAAIVQHEAKQEIPVRYCSAEAATNIMLSRHYYTPSTDAAPEGHRVPPPPQAGDEQAAYKATVRAHGAATAIMRLAADLDMFNRNAWGYPDGTTAVEVPSSVVFRDELLPWVVCRGPLPAQRADFDPLYVACAPAAATHGVVAAPVMAPVTLSLGAAPDACHAMDTSGDESPSSSAATSYDHCVEFVATYDVVARAVVVPPLGRMAVRPAPAQARLCDLHVIVWLGNVAKFQEQLCALCEQPHPVDPDAVRTDEESIAAAVSAATTEAAQPSTDEQQQQHDVPRPVLASTDLPEHLHRCHPFDAVRHERDPMRVDRVKTGVITLAQFRELAQQCDPRTVFCVVVSSPRYKLRSARAAMYTRDHIKHAAVRTGRFDASGANAVLPRVPMELLDLPADADASAISAEMQDVMLRILSAPDHASAGRHGTTSSAAAVSLHRRQQCLPAIPFLDDNATVATTPAGIRTALSPVTIGDQIAYAVRNTLDIPRAEASDWLRSATPVDVAKVARVVLWACKRQTKHHDEDEDDDTPATATADSDPATLRTIVRMGALWISWRMVLGCGVLTDIVGTAPITAMSVVDALTGRFGISVTEIASSIALQFLISDRVGEHLSARPR